MVVAYRWFSKAQECCEQTVEMRRCIVGTGMFLIASKRFGDTIMQQTDRPEAHMCSRQLLLFCLDCNDFVASERCEQTAETPTSISGICRFSLGLQRFAGLRVLRTHRQYVQMHHRTSVFFSCVSIRFGCNRVLRTDRQDAQRCFRQLWLFRFDYNDLVPSERCEQTAEMPKDISRIL